MEPLGLVAALILVAVFSVAGIAKLADLGGTRAAVLAFGAPRVLVSSLAVALPAAELAVAVLLVPASTRVAGTVGALVLLGAFSIAIAVSLARGRAPECHCFGQIHSAPASWRTLVRNGLLAGLAVLVLGSGLAGAQRSAVAWTAGLGGAGIVALALGLAIVAVTWAGTLGFLALLRSHGRALQRLETIERRLAEAGIEIENEYAPPESGLDPGTPAPAFAAVDARGASSSLDDLLAPGRPLLLLFTSPACGPCQALLPEIAAWQKAYADRLTIAIAAGGDEEAARAEAQEHGLERVLADHALAIHGAFEAGGTPGAVLVAPDGTIASHVAEGADAIERLLARALETDAEPEEHGLAVGSSAPHLGLSTLEGAPLSFDDGDVPSLVLFWNPECGFCSSMRDDLLAWEDDPPAGAPRLVVVSSGDEASTRSDGFSSCVVLDPEFELGAAFGAGGTPMAVLVDPEGRIASPLAAGSEAVLELAGARDRPASNRPGRAHALGVPR